MSSPHQKKKMGRVRGSSTGSAHFFWWDADGVEGAGITAPQHPLHSLCVDRHLERKERESSRAFAWVSGMLFFSVGRGVSVFCELPCQRVGVLRGGSWGKAIRSAKAAFVSSGNQPAGTRVVGLTEMNGSLPAKTQANRVDCELA